MKTDVRNGMLNIVLFTFVCAYGLSINYHMENQINERYCLCKWLTFDFMKFKYKVRIKHTGNLSSKPGKYSTRYTRIFSYIYHSSVPLFYTNTVLNNRRLVIARLLNCLATCWMTEVLYPEGAVSSSRMALFPAQSVTGLTAEPWSWQPISFCKAMVFTSISLTYSWHSNKFICL
jgi:hypothetical protein